MKTLWTEDEMTPRADRLAREVSATDQVVVPRNPSWFQNGDIVRLGEEDLYATGEINEWGNEIYRVRNEAVLVRSVVGNKLVCKRSYGVNPARDVPAGQTLTIIGTAA